MAFVNPDPTYLDQTNRVFALYQRCADARDAQGKAEPDVRHVSFNNIC